MNAPSYTALYCIKADYQGGETIYSNFEDALLRINENQRNILLNKSFFFKTDPAKFYNTPDTGIQSNIFNNDR